MTALIDKIAAEVARELLLDPDFRAELKAVVLASLKRAVDDRGTVYRADRRADHGLPPGIRRRDRRHGYEAYVRLHRGRGGLPTKHFPEGTPISVMLAWIENQRGSAVRS